MLAPGVVLLCLVSGQEVTPLRVSSYHLPPTAAIVAHMPPDFTDGSRYRSGVLKEMRFVRQTGRRATLLVTPMAPVPADFDFARLPDSFRQFLNDQRTSLAKTAVEAKLMPVTRTTAAGELTFVTATDKVPKEGEFKQVSQGFWRLGDVPLTVTILHDDLSTRDEVLTAMSRWQAFGVVDRAAAPPAGEGVLAKRCGDGDGLACGLEFEFFREGDRAALVSKLEKGCKLGSAFACASLSGVYDGVGAPNAKTQQALDLAVKACVGGSALACLNAVKMIGQKRGTLPKSAKADYLWYADRACGLAGDGDGVCRASDDSNLDAPAYLKKQTSDCDAGKSRACRLLGWARESGYGAPVDVAGMREAYVRGCKGGDSWSCFRAALFTTDPGERQRSMIDACDRGSGEACYSLTLPNYKEPVAAQRKRARNACEAGVFQGCARVMADYAASP